MNKIRRHGKSPIKNQGFTLLELMVTVIILAILTTAAMPFYQSLISSQRLKNATFDMTALFIFARSEAIKRNANVNINMDSTQTNLVVTTTGVASPLRSQPVFKGVQLNCIPNPPNCPNGGATYNSSGRLTNAFPPLQLDELKNGVAAPSGNSRCITIDMSGRPNVKKGTC